VITEAAANWVWNWKLVGNETAQEKAELDLMLKASQQFISAIMNGEEPRWLSFLGRSGAGKTHLAERIREWLLRYGEAMYDRHVRAVKNPDLDDIRYYYGYAQEGNVMVKWGKLIQDCRERNFARFTRASEDYYKIIDDLGANSFDREGAATVYATQQMAELLDRRLRKWTVITSNFGRKEFAEKFDVRVSSRLMRDRNVIVEANVRDYAIRKEKEHDRR
jgi:DNA replication protein DnaC